MFKKILPVFYQIPLKILPNLTDFSPQLMACMILALMTGITLAIVSHVYTFHLILSIYILLRFTPRFPQALLFNH